MDRERVDWGGAIDRAGQHSPYLTHQLASFPDIAGLLAGGDVEGAWAAAAAAGVLNGSAEDDLPAVMHALRIEKRARGLVIAIADLAGAWPLETVCTHLSDFADAAAERAIAAAFADRYPGENPRGFTMLGLGKHGSRELNYSSDIDPILLFDPVTMPCRAKEDPVEAAVRIGKKVVSILADRTEDGYVFRVDLRLRPSPEATPIVLPVEAAISYYESAALGWEQAAFIRSRGVAGDRALSDYFLQAIRPFIWRRSLDFGAIDGILDISRRIRDHYASGQVFAPGYDLKRGRGGIREVEFFVQIHQLIHGGRNAHLRAPATMDVLAALSIARIIDAEVAAQLTTAYTLYRTVEHRLQMIDDRQTHQLPPGREALDRVGHLHGLANGEALLALLRPHVEWVGANYDRLNPFMQAERMSLDEHRLRDQLVAIEFPDVETAMARIAGWRQGSIRALRSAAATDALEKLLPDLFRGLARAPDPVVALNRFALLIDRLPTAVNFFKLLVANKAVLGLLVDVLCYAPPLAEELSNRVDLLDGLIGASALEPLPPLADLVGLLDSREQGDDYQMLLDRVRQKVGDRRFALGVQVICGVADVLQASAGYARLAEAAVDVLTHAAVAEFEKAHGRVPGGELVILAMGRFGGGLMTHASDLDLIFLFTGDFAAESDGTKPLGATQYFNRLAQRVGNALSVPTASGPLYDVDTRLRPSGSQGLLCVSLASFARYHAEAAWAWEHLALTRARPIYGSNHAREALADVVQHTLLAERDGDALAAAAVRMRRDIAKHKPPQGEFDVKQMHGGLVDLEFLIHVNQFRARTGFAPDLRLAIDALVAAGVLAADIRSAHDLLTRYLIVSRLVTTGAQEPPEETHRLVAQACGAADWTDLLAKIAAARHSIATAWEELERTFGDADDRG